MTTDRVAGKWGGKGAWIYRALIVAGAAFMLYSWYLPWWTAKFSPITGSNHMVLHPWGVDVNRQVRRFSDNSLYDMPAFFSPLVWTYLGACMLLLLISLFVSRQISLGRLRISVASILIALVGLSYVGTAVIAYVVGTIKAAAAGTSFIGRTTMSDPNYTDDFYMTSQLESGYWIAVAAGVVLIVVALIRRVFVRPQTG